MPVLGTIDDVARVARSGGVQMETLERLAEAGDVGRLSPALRRVVPEYEPMPVAVGHPPRGR